MDNVLDNPIWFGALTGNSTLSKGEGNIRFFDDDVSNFVGFPQPSSELLSSLHAIWDREGPAFFITADKFTHIPDKWNLVYQTQIHQMVGTSVTTREIENRLVALNQKDAPAMLALATLTAPGPFLINTLDYGNYYGIYEGDKLAAMAGCRTAPDPYIEISAVCTHPDFRGKGYGAIVTQNIINKILETPGKIPFLHANTENNQALRVYKKLGFHERKLMWVHVFHKK